MPARPPKPTRKSAPAEPRRLFMPGGIEVVHEDEHLIVLDKPAGLLTSTMPGQPGECVFGAVKARVRDQAKRRGTRVWIVHRLDKEASGLLVFAKTEKAFAFLKEEFRTKRVHRLYAAVVEGEIRAEPDTQRAPDVPGLARVPQPPGGTIQSFLFEDERGIVRSTQSPSRVKRPALSDEDTPDAKLAVTHWKVQGVGSGRTLLQVRLETGRKNQIRVHMQEIGRPIVGDRRYGAKTDPLDRLCLHAFELGFTHPATAQSARFRSPTPGSFFGLVGKKDLGTSAVPVEAPAHTGRDRVDPGRTAPVAELGGDRRATPDQSWDHVAAWYDQLIDDRGSDHHEMVILPGALRLLAPKLGDRVLDLACGQGVLARRLLAANARVVGVDSSPKLIDAARRASPTAEFIVGDARRVAEVAKGPFDRAACVMALMNIDPLSPVLEGVRSLLKPGGRFVAVMLHPAFRAPGQTSWEWEQPRHTKASARDARQFRRIDGYLSLAQREIIMNPGGAAHGKPAVTTITYHRPVQAYINAFAAAGLLVDAMEEWPSVRVSQPGPRSAEENRARREIPMFLALRGVAYTASDPRA